MARLGIQTDYNGTHFRSRVEARWACFFDLVGWRWEYEPFDLHGYIPDFLLLGKREVLVEVKAYETIGTLTIVADETQTIGGRDVLVLGNTPFPDGGDELGRWWQLGVIAEHDFGGAAVSSAQWHKCGSCGNLAFHSADGYFGSRPCGHYDGDSYLGFADPIPIREMWATARNETQWKPTK